MINHENYRMKPMDKPTKPLPKLPRNPFPNPFTETFLKHSAIFFAPNSQRLPNFSYLC